MDVATKQEVGDPLDVDFEGFAGTAESDKSTGTAGPDKSAGSDMDLSDIDAELDKI